jgi:adenylate kinase
MSRKQVIIIFGAPGAGKGTQAELISDKLGFFYFETSKALERAFSPENSIKEIEADGKNYLMSDEREMWKKGELLSPPFVTKLVVENISKIFENGESLILAGSPRTVYEVERVTPVLEKLYGKENIKVILLEITPETTIFRNSHRKICELMRHSILFNDETEKLTLCPLDGSHLIKRKDLDDPETIKVRIKEYTERTLPMVEYFEKNNIKVNKINGEQYISDVFNDVLKIINNDNN